MKKLFQDLYQTTLYSQGALKTHAYFLKVGDNHILFYNTNNEDDLKEIEKLGGIDFQCLSHRHEVSSSLNSLKERFNHKILLDKDEDLEKDFLNDSKEIEDLGIKVFLTRGHTKGGNSYFFESKISGLKYLFSGDTYFLWDGKFSTLVLSNDGGNKKELIKSLEFYKNLTPDIIVPSASLGESSYIKVNQKEWQKFLDESIKKLR